MTRLVFAAVNLAVVGVGQQLLRYMGRIWESCLRDRPQAKGLPVIVPVVLAQNAGT